MSRNFIHIAYFWGLCWSLIPLLSQAQDEADSTFKHWKLDTVAVSGLRIQSFQEGHHIQPIDSMARSSSVAGTLAQLLRFESGVTLRQYGPGSLATISIRGGGPEHTAIVWNGFNLQSSMNGQYDLNLLPVFFMDRVQVQYGGSGALYGNGSVGGAIHFQQHLPLEAGTQAGAALTLGSFDMQQEALQFRISKQKWAIRFRMFRHRADNDFRFTNTAQAGSPEMRLSHARLERMGILQENAIQLSPHQRLDLRFWVQDNYREIPPMMTQARSSAYQEDRFLRSSLQWTHSKARYTNIFRVAGMWEKLTYVDPEKALLAKNPSQTVIAEFERNQSLGSGHMLNVGINHTREYAQADGYGGIDVSQHRSALFVSYKYRIHKLTGVLSIREAYASQGWSPVIPSLSLSYPITSALNLEGRVSRNFRWPTFNERFWRLGGNLDLLPESGWSEEVRLKWNNGKALEVTIGAYNSRIRNRIVWQPGREYWAPENVWKVWSRGVEMEGGYSKKGRNWTYGLTGIYTYTRATYEEGAQALSQGKQLIYVPLHNARLSVWGVYKKWSLRGQHSWVSKQFTTRDQSRELPGYQLSRGEMGYSLSTNHWSINIQLQVENIWNTAYQVVAWRPMPGRSIQLNIQTNWNP